ncbi:hypothetical protein RyT2_11560 [Pseudolactococcus yaeyamensis]
MDDIWKIILTTGISVLTGAVGFIFRHVNGRLDKHEEGIQDIKQDYVKESRYQRDMDKVLEKLDKVALKEDFVREFAKLDAHIEVLRQLMTKGDKA